MAFGGSGQAAALLCVTGLLLAATLCSVSGSAVNCPGALESDNGFENCDPASWSGPSSSSDSSGSDIMVVYDAGNQRHFLSRGSVVQIAVTQNGTARGRSAESYPLGTTFSASIKCAEGNTSGIVSSFYLSSEEGQPDKDEVDFEFVGNNKTFVQTNYFTSGAGDHEQYVALGWDCSEAYHTFTIQYDVTTKFFIDGQYIREGSGFSKRVYLYVIAWTGGDRYWVGEQSYDNTPYLFTARDLEIYEGG